MCYAILKALSRRHTILIDQTNTERDCNDKITPCLSVQTIHWLNSMYIYTPISDPISPWGSFRAAEPPNIPQSTDWCTCMHHDGYFRRCIKWKPAFSGRSLCRLGEADQGGKTLTIIISAFVLKDYLSDRPLWGRNNTTFRRSRRRPRAPWIKHLFHKNPVQYHTLL